MNILDFQKRLGEILSMAQANGNKISTEQVEKMLKDLMLSPEQTEKIYDYLAAEKVAVAGRSTGAKVRDAGCAQAPEGSGVSEAARREVVPLDDEEQRYLENYRQILAQLPAMSDTGLKRAMEVAIAGNEEARQRVIEAYMPKVLEIALEMHYGDVFLGDAVSEGNLSLLSAVRELEDIAGAEARVLEAVRGGIHMLSEEQTEQKRRDEAMVEKVRGLEEKIREITDDGELQFSVDELAVFLDMSRQEIEDVLRLAGDSDNK